MSSDLTRRLKAEALRLGFAQVGIAPAVAPPGYPRFLDWLNAGYAAEMKYLERRAEARSHPESLMPGVRSVVVVSFVYGGPSPPPSGATQAKVARYAQGADYHEVLWRRLETLLDWVQSECPGVSGRASPIPPAARTRFRTPGRPRLDRQEYHADQS